jgi:hypothetical protein
MLRFFGVIAACLIISIPFGNGVAQVAPSRPGAVERILPEQNEIIAKLASIDSNNLPRVENELRRLSVGTREGGFRGGSPIQAELSQIAANPAFADAFDHDPGGTLILLRWVNDDIRKSQTKASAR